MKYSKSYDETNNKFVSKIAQKYHIDNHVAEYIVHLGYDSMDKVQNYLEPSEKCFHNPFLLNNMKEVCARIKTAINNEEKILVFGDYDVDGICATTILIKYFESIGVKADFYLPSRLEDGYGLTEETVLKIVEKFNPNLVITVDCGIACSKEVDLLKSLGIDVIVTDHHELTQELPKCLIIEPKLTGQKYPFIELCGAGVALKLVYALTDYDFAKQLMPISAIATIADMMVLKDENRFLVKKGLELFEEYCPNGLKYLLGILNLSNKKINAEDIAFKIAPKLNSAGRMGDASGALKLFIESDLNKIVALTDSLIKLNDKRQKETSRVFNEAMKVESQNEKIVIAYGDDWQSGVLGIVASKVVEKLKKPAIILGYDKRLNMYVGSARSIEGINILQLINDCNELLERFGGHSLAAGITISKDNINKLKCKLNTLLSSEFIINDELKYYDIELNANEINFNLINSISKLEPFGLGNPKPLFMMKIGKVEAVPMKNHNEYMNINIDGIKGVCFNSSDYVYLLNSEVQKVLMFFPFVDVFKNKETIKIRIEDIIYCNGVYFDDDFCNKQKIKQSLYVEDVPKNVVLFHTLDEISNMKDSLYITYNFDNEINQFCKQKNIQVNVGKFSKKIVGSQLVIAPTDFNRLEKFNNIVFLEGAINDAFIANLNKMYPNTMIYENKSVAKNCECRLVCDRMVFGLVYTNIKDGPYYDDIAVYNSLFVSTNISYEQMCFCLTVFKELNLLEIQNNENEIVIKKHFIKTELTNSMLYQHISKIEKGEIK